MRLAKLTAALLSTSVIALLHVSSAGAASFDEAAAKAYAKKNDCFKCHAPDKTKKGPSYKKIAAKYKGKPDWEAKLTEQVTKAQKVKLEDGTEEDHKTVDSKDKKEIANLLNWIMAQ